MRKIALQLITVAILVSLVPHTVSAQQEADYFVADNAVMSTVQNHKYIGLFLQYGLEGLSDSSKTGKIKIRFSYDQEGKDLVKSKKISIVTIKGVEGKLDPEDYDLDGIVDKYDKCGTIPGYAINEGCPIATDKTNCVKKNSKYQQTVCKQDEFKFANENTLYNFMGLDLQYKKSLSGKTIYAHIKVVADKAIIDQNKSNNKTVVWSVSLP